MTSRPMLGSRSCRGWSRRCNRRAVAGDKDIGIMGGADTIRQALAAGYVDELFVTIASGARRREAAVRGFDRSIDLQQVDARQSVWATHLRYRVKK